MKLNKSKMRYWIEKHLGRRYAIKANLRTIKTINSDGSSSILMRYSLSFEPHYWTDKNGIQFRINAIDLIQIGDDNFDRWANSVAAELPIEKPLTEAYFADLTSRLYIMRDQYLKSIA